MTKPKPKPWINYWRNSLADGERMERSLIKLKHYTLDRLNLPEGYLPVPETVRLINRYEKKINEEKGITDREDPEWEAVNQVELVIAPFAVLSAYEHTKRVGETRKVHPFWFSALTDRSGRLSVPERKFPVFIRRALDPAAQEDQVLSLSTVDRVDEIMAEGMPHPEKWAEYWQFVQSFFERATGQNIDQVRLEGLRVLTEYVVAVDEDLEGASDNIIKLYDHLARQARVPALFCTLTKPEPPLRALVDEARWTQLLNDHLGQMRDDFPLSFSQRQSLHHYARLEVGEVLAINGPPGTGKTTLLQSIVAHEIVKSAVQGREPFVVVASSTNNQAITNIISSFGRTRSTRKQLAERWLPEVSSYALYLPASSVRPRAGIHYVRPNGEGFPREIENPRYLKKARAYYLQQVSRWAGSEYTDVKKATDKLQEKVKDLTTRLDQGAQAGIAHSKVRALLIAYRGEDNLAHYYERNRCRRTVLDEDETQLRHLLDKYYQLREEESIGWELVSSFRWGRERRAIPYKRLWQTLRWQEITPDFTDVNWLENFILEKLDLIEQIKAADESWEQWRAAYQLPNDPQTLFGQLDTTVRHEAFLLATHYWEGRWLLEAEEAVREDTLRKNRHQYMVRRFRRYAMLTPCLVATFYMTPRFFTYTGYDGNDPYPKFPMLGFIDLLIVDEAGQVAPEVGAASFALAQRAVVIGDVKQINPIWKIPSSIDQANLRKFGLEPEVARLGDGYRGFSAAEGSVMRLAQRASYYQVSQETRGMWLTEHRRCFDEIIRYCNDLAYHGLLEPRRGTLSQADPPRLLPAVGYVHSVGTSRMTQGSRANEEEANAIAQWLVVHRDRIAESYQTPKETKLLEDIVGVITPFTAQKNLIRRALRKAKINVRRMKVGTVHALQGAERPVIIFSMTYGANEPSRSFFFDRGENMLNVAVSRAQDSFILFGDLSILDEHAASPSGKLIRHIRQEGRAVEQN